MTHPTVVGYLTDVYDPIITHQQLLDIGLSPQKYHTLSAHTWWGVGGPADLFLDITNTAQLQAAMVVANTTHCPLFVLGAGSNILISDDGVAGLVIKLGGEFCRSDKDGDTLIVGAGLKLSVLLNRAKRHEWPGLHVFAGIPGTIGGAVKMNAGASLGCTADILIQIQVITGEGLAVTILADDLDMQYRHVGLPEGAIISQATLRLQGTAEHSQALIKQHLAHRSATQPLAARTVGSTFRNPPDDYAGRLIESAGLKGHSLGGASVSHKHANFVINDGTATAGQLKSLIRDVQRRVQDSTGVLLVPEVHFIGR